MMVTARQLSTMYADLQERQAAVLAQQRGMEAARADWLEQQRAGLERQREILEQQAALGDRAARMHEVRGRCLAFCIRLCRVHCPRSSFLALHLWVDPDAPKLNKLHPTAAAPPPNRPTRSRPPR
jgi:hypothetical protein